MYGGVVDLVLPANVTIYEVGPRDGLQNEARQVPTADKVRFIEGLVAAGVRHIEATSFVSPKWIPQLADSSAVIAALPKVPGVTYSALVPNRRGLDAALEAGLAEIAVFLSASETHSRKNINKSIAEAVATFADIVPPALAAGVRVRAYISTVFGCPYEGDVAVATTNWLCRELLGMGCYQISLGDTIGVANPRQVASVLTELLAQTPAAALAVHFHDTQGTALANCLVALQMGITTIDSSAGGLGGCPYAPGAAGNLATDDVVAMLHAMGVHTGIDLDKLVETSRLVSTFVDHELPSKYMKAHLGKQARARRQQEKQEKQG